MKTQEISRVVSVLFILALLAGCHDGNSAGAAEEDNTTITPSGSSNWGELTWDQDNWS